MMSIEQQQNLWKEMSDPNWKPKVIEKNCTICKTSFVTNRKNKEVCSWNCRQEHNRRHARFYARVKRMNLKGKIACEICGFSDTIDHHEEGGMVYALCPNHHALITRNLKTLDQVLGSL